MASELERARTDESLIPVIRDHEARLRELLEEARRKAEQMVKEAERESMERVKAREEELPQEMERQRAAEAKRIEEEAAGNRAMLANVGREVENIAERNLDAAVSAIVKAVWPEGGG